MYWGDIMKEVNIKPPFIKLGQFLKLVDMIDSGGEEKIFLATHEVKVNGELENRRGRKLYENDEVSVLNQQFKITCK